jgi:hypothetical protein
MARPGKGRRNRTRIRTCTCGQPANPPPPCSSSSAAATSCRAARRPWPQQPPAAGPPSGPVTCSIPAALARCPLTWRRCATSRSYSLRRRMYIGPTSMDAELALVMCNVAKVKRGDIVLDPYVGTGSITVAAAHWGAKTLGAPPAACRLLLGAPGAPAAPRAARTTAGAARCPWPPWRPARSPPHPMLPPTAPPCPRRGHRLPGHSGRGQDRRGRPACVHLEQLPAVRAGAPDWAAAHGHPQPAPQTGAGGRAGGDSGRPAVRRQSRRQEGGAHPGRRGGAEGGGGRGTCGQAAAAAAAGTAG